MSLRHTQRLFIKDDLTQGGGVSVDSDQAHYLQHVLRLKAGDTVRLFNGRDGEWRGVLAAAGKRTLTIDIHEPLRQQASEPDLWLCAAPIKKAHFDFMIEKATELGVSAIRPILTQRTQIRAVNTERAQAIAVEAAEQSERLNVPVIEAPLSLPELIAAWPRDRALIVCAEWGEAAAVHHAMQSPALMPAHGVARKAAVLTGPEGGLAADELDALRALPDAHFIRLGPRILRADTAAIAALSVFQAVAGDWVN
jgi:16S rRNA (uracil1498-N3)-methyltransferase